MSKSSKAKKNELRYLKASSSAWPGTGSRANFTVRKISYGVGVERIFPIHSPRIEKVEVMSHGKVRRAKLYYLRELSGKAARLTEQDR